MRALRAVGIWSLPHVLHAPIQPTCLSHAPHGRHVLHGRSRAWHLHESIASCIIGMTDCWLTCPHDSARFAMLVISCGMRCCPSLHVSASTLQLSASHAALSLASACMFSTFALFAWSLHVDMIALHARWHGSCSPPAHHQPGSMLSACLPCTACIYWLVGICRFTERPAFSACMLAWSAHALAHGLHVCPPTLCRHGHVRMGRRCWPHPIPQPL